MSTSSLVKQRIQRIRRGAPFSITGFYELGSPSSVQKALSRLSKEGMIERVSKGIYVRPKPLASLPSIKVTTSAEQVARLWAKEHRYTLVKQGQESAYRLGIQTQAPVRTVFWSNGPSRTFVIGNEVVEVRHTKRQQLLRWHNQPEGELFRSLIVTPAASAGLQVLSIAFKRLGLSGPEARSTVARLRSSSLPQIWQHLLKEFDRRDLA